MEPAGACSHLLPPCASRLPFWWGEQHEPSVPQFPHLRNVVDNSVFCQSHVTASRAKAVCVLRSPWSHQPSHPTKSRQRPTTVVTASWNREPCDHPPLATRRSLLGIEWLTTEPLPALSCWPSTCV